MTAMAYVPEVFAHQWLPSSIELKSLAQIEPYFQQLIDRPIGSVSELESWLSDVGEFTSAVGQEGEQRHIAMTCQADDPARKAAHLEWIRDIEPVLKPYYNAIRAKYLDCSFRSGLPADRFMVFDRMMQNQRDLYREANIPRETELAELKQQYQEIIGAMTVVFRGQEHTLVQMGRYLEETDRPTRQAAWELMARRRLEDCEQLDNIFNQMLKRRGEIASEAGFSRYTDFAYRERERFDYGEAEAVTFQNAIERVVVPLVNELNEESQKRLGLDSLRPWDVEVDVLGRAPLRPFQSAEELAERTQTIFERIDPELGAQFAFLSQRGLLDLANRKGKAPGGYQATLEDDRLPFIFMNAVGVDGDLRTLLHEGGHAFHTLAARGEPLAAYRNAPIEFCEVASMSMELLGCRDLDVLYTPENTQRSYRQLLEGIVKFLPYMAAVDAFQHWVYDHPGHMVPERQAAWNGLLNRFGARVNWSGYEDVRTSSWHRQLHVFLYPFYYIEYGIAQLGALQVWQNARTDRPGAIAAYRRGLSVGGARPLPELFAAAGIKFDFSEPTLRSLIEDIRAELGSLAV